METPLLKDSEHEESEGSSRETIDQALDEVFKKLQTDYYCYRRVVKAVPFKDGETLVARKARLRKAIKDTHLQYGKTYPQLEERENAIGSITKVFSGSVIVETGSDAPDDSQPIITMRRPQKEREKLWSTLSSLQRIVEDDCFLERLVFNMIEEARLLLRRVWLSDDDDYEEGMSFIHRKDCMKLLASMLSAISVFRGKAIQQEYHTILKEIAESDVETTNRLGFEQAKRYLLTPMLIEKGHCRLATDVVNTWTDETPVFSPGSACVSLAVFSEAEMKIRLAIADERAASSSALSPPPRAKVSTRSPQEQGSPSTSDSGLTTPERGVALSGERKLLQNATAKLKKKYSPYWKYFLFTSLAVVSAFTIVMTCGFASIAYGLIGAYFAQEALAAGGVGLGVSGVGLFSARQQSRVYHQMQQQSPLSSQRRLFA